MAARSKPIQVALWLPLVRQARYEVDLKDYVISLTCAF